MSESTRTSFGSAQRFVLVGIALGAIIGIAFGAIATGYYFTNFARVVYAGGAYPDELTENYQDHYIQMVADAYIVDPNAEDATNRLISFDTETIPVIRRLAIRSADYAAQGRTVESQRVNELAELLKQEKAWPDSDVQTVVSELTARYQADPLRLEAVNLYSALLTGTVPQQPQPGVDQPTTEEVPPTAEPAAEESSFPWVVCIIGLVVVAIVVFLFFRYFAKQREAAMNKKKEVVYEGEGTPPIMQWNSNYTEGRTPYDESITLETEAKDFLGEAGIGMNTPVPGSGQKQVMDFDLWVFDKTDINTYSRILMSEKAYNDSDIRSQVDMNPLAEPVLAEKGMVVTIDSKTMRIEVTLEEVKFDETNTYFEELQVKMNIFLQEGVEIKAGEMDIPDHI